MGVASILPFMQLIAAPNAIEQSSWLTAAFEFFQFTDHRQMLIYFGLSIIVIIGITNAFSVFTLWLQYKYCWDIAHNMAMRLLRIYLEKPYKYFLKTNSSELQTYLISEVNMLTGGVIIPLIELVSRTFVSLVIFSLLLIVDTRISLIMFVSLGGAYLLVYLSRQKFLKHIGQLRIDMNLSRYKTLSELLNGIKTVMVYNEQSFFYKRYGKASKGFCEIHPKFSIILATPRYVLEFLAFGSILAVTIYLFVSAGNIQNAIPRLSLYAVAGYRLLPALQKAFTAAAKFRNNYPVLEKLYDDLMLGLKIEGELSTDKTPMPFNKELSLNSVRFNYDESDQKIIKDLNLKVEKGQTIAIIGSTGSGKTTLIDIIVGLLQPKSGHLQVDATPLDTDNTKTWQNNLAYVPQDVFLFDDTILSNIVLGREREEIDFERVKKATQLADIYDFIQGLPEGFETGIGERGVRLSGGQRQRLGLARALYRQPNVLVLDEATSALDSITEKGIIDSLKTLSKDLTTIIIAHRLSTVRHADCIYILNEGEIIAHGDYESLMYSNDTFKEMVQLS